MAKQYSQSRARQAITAASFKAIFSNPSAIIFSILFPIIFILIFGAFGRSGAISYRIAMTEQSDTTSAFFQALRKNNIIRVVNYPDSNALNDDLVRGRLTAIVDLQTKKDSSGKEQYDLQIRSTTASSNTVYAFLQTLDYLKLKFEAPQQDASQQLVSIGEPKIEEVRKYRQIDFILPGQLGFSILFSTLFGIAFTFFGLREQLVLKRFYASPVNRLNILLGIGMSRLFFQLLSVVVLIGFGYFFLNFTLQHGLLTFLELIVFTVIMLFLLMGVGLIFSSVAKTDTSIPLLINLFGFPQMLLSGTFFTIEVFPEWLQKICHYLPLTQFNNAVRKISFEGMHLHQCGEQLAILAGWMLITYLVLNKVLKWE